MNYIFSLSDCVRVDYVICTYYTVSIKYTWMSMHLPVAVPSIVETHTEKSLRSMGPVMSGVVITTQYSTLEFGPSVTVRFIGGSIPILTPV